MTDRKAQFHQPDRGVRKARVLVVAPSFDILGGQAVQAARLVSRLREEDVLDVGFLPINPRLPGVLHAVQSIKYVRTIVTSLLYVATLFARIPRYDVLHIFSASYFSFVLAPTPAILIGKLFSKKVLLNYHSGEARDHLSRWPSASSTIRLVDSLVVPSAYLARVFQEFGLKADAINNIVELHEFAFRERNKLRPVFLSNRNLEKHYGVDRVLRAFALIQAKTADAELVIAGDGSQRASLEDLARELKLRNTTFVGRVEHDQIAEQYNNADVYLNGSEIDNQPLSIIEAFACGLPIVTTGAGGIPDMVHDGVNGFVVDCGDYETMAQRAIELLENSELASRFAKAGLEECGQYSWPVVKDRWLKVYSQLVRGPQPQKKSASRLQRLAGMSFDELRVRISQKLSVMAERQEWSSLNVLPSDRKFASLINLSSNSGPGQDLLQCLRSRKSPAFLKSFDHPEATVAALRESFPHVESQIVREAENILKLNFRLFGREISFGDPIDWRLEPVSKRSAPLLHWSEIDYLNPDVAGDKKITWELNRHQHFLRVGQAYWLRRDERYATAFVDQLESWMDSNPPKLGINWASSLEVSFRAISWIWALEFFKHSPALTREILLRVWKFLYLHARHLESYLSTYFSPNTHLTGEALGLYYLGTMLPEFREAERWRNTGRKILTEQLSRQVRADGVYFEQSSYYQRYTADFYTHFLLLAELNGDSLDPVVGNKLQAMLDHLMYITQPDGTTPLFGDDDGGRLVSLDHRAPNDFRAALSTGAVLFRRGDYKTVAGGFAEETLWLMGENAARAFADLESKTPAQQSKAFNEGGYYVMRDGWESDANYLLFDCGPHGANNCGHAHADALSVQLTAHGKPLLVDPGTHTYTGSFESRDWFRGSAAHNTLVIDGESSSIPAGPFSWTSVARCQTTSWISERRFDYVEGQHDGYERLPDPATHTRSILFLKKDYWIVRDRIASAGEHHVELPLHFAPEVEVTFGASGDSLTAKTLENVGISAFSFAEGGAWSREDGWVSHCYSNREAAPVLVFSARTKADGEIVTFLLPQGFNSSKELRVKEVEAVGGRAFEIRSREGRDLVMLRDPMIEARGDCQARFQLQLDVGQILGSE